MTEDKISLSDNKELTKLGEQMQEIAIQYEKDCEEYWNNLPQEDQLKAFYSVVKRIYKGEIEDEGSYRHVLYGVFGFGLEAYVIGMECGYMDIHNAIVHNASAVEP
jgi:hypothetical protein